MQDFTPRKYDLSFLELILAWPVLRRHGIYYIHDMNACSVVKMVENLEKFIIFKDIFTKK